MRKPVIRQIRIKYDMSQAEPGTALAQRKDSVDRWVQSRAIGRGNDMRRIARFFFWGGVAALILGMGACGVSFTAAFASVTESDTMDVAENIGGFGVGAIIVGLIAVFIGAFFGAIIKAFSKD